jgi:hypothetical protein
MGVFDDYQDEVYKYQYSGQLIVGTIAGGTPSDPNVAEGWLRTKLGVNKDEVLRTMVAEAMIARGITADEAAEEVSKNKHLNGFKRDANGLYVEGRQLKAALKEAASVAVAAGHLSARGWGKTNKGLLSYLAEHVFVVEDILYLGAETEAGKPVETIHQEPSGISQRFVHTFRGSGIQYEEYVTNATIDFTVISDHDFETDDGWKKIWTTGQQQGLGASRSQGYGRYEVARWDRIK